MKAELARRESLASKLETYLKARPGVWVPIHELAAIGGVGGWRTRLSELARRERAPLYIEHNGKNGAASCHRYLPWEPLARAADVLPPDQMRMEFR